MKELFLTVAEISISAGLIILLLLIFSPCLNRRYAAKWKYFIWIAVAARLVIPLNFRWPVRPIVVDVPARITAPVNMDAENAVPLVLQAAHKIAPVTPLDIAAWLWLAGCLLFLSAHLLSFWHFKRRIIRDGDKVEDEKILRHVCRLAGELRIRPDIQVVRYPDAGSPMMTGFFKPVLVLPGCGYSEEEMFFILKHELIHFKRRDIYFKLLFVAANALHWFNPLIYAMRKEAVIDMELSCDERVVQQTPYAVRKAYTETLFSTLSRQYKKGTTLTTQFYGGKQIMKKRFRNILIESKKRNGAIVCMGAVCLTLASGMLVGCSAADISSGVKAQTGVETGNSDAVTDPLESPADTDFRNEEKVTGVDTNSEGSVEIILSADREQMVKIVDEFAGAYFSGDVNAVKGLLPDSYAWDIEAYEGSGTISDMSIRGLPDADAEELAVGSLWTVSVQYRDSVYEDMFQYLTLELIKGDRGWEIQFYGMEG